MSNALLEKIKKKEVKVCVVGLGYVGFPLLELLIKKKFHAIGFDIDKKVVDNAIKNGVPATLNDKEALADADCAIICVPTPVEENHRPNLEFVESAAETISKYLKRDSLVILESTVAPGTTEEILLPILEKSGLKQGDFYVVHCPERIDPGNKEWTVQNLPRVLGGIDEESAEAAFVFYKNVLDADVVKLSSAKAAEAVKIVENTFRDINIAFVNELAKSFDEIGIDISEVIGGARSKPFGFMPHYPGCGVGGHCIAIDPYYLIEKAEKSGFNHRFLKLAREINNSMPKYTVKKINKGLNMAKIAVNGSNIAILGLAYKPGVEDTRESPAFPIIQELKKWGANLTIYDPYLPDLSDVKTLDDALRNMDCIVIITAHEEFKRITPEKIKENGIKVVIDGRNVLDSNNIKRLGIIYEGIGR
ncbi:MAG: nucleotide sugar dehydrogenase [Thermoplasmatales archaeon]|nr:nucleotide sugar dehydrogenase [Thermoplasmatales archaeon]